MPYDWIDPHSGNIPQVNREDAALSDVEKAIAEERSRGLRVPGIKPGKLVGEEDSVRGVPASDPRGLVFDHDTGALRPISDEDYEKPRRAAKADDKPATEKEQDKMEAAAAERRAATKK